MVFGVKIEWEVMIFGMFSVIKNGIFEWGKRGLPTQLFVIEW